VIFLHSASARTSFATVTRSTARRAQQMLGPYGLPALRQVRCRRVAPGDPLAAPGAGLADTPNSRPSATLAAPPSTSSPAQPRGRGTLLAFSQPASLTKGDTGFGRSCGCRRPSGGPSRRKGPGKILLRISRRLGDLKGPKPRTTTPRKPSHAAHSRPKSGVVKKRPGGSSWGNFRQPVLWRQRDTRRRHWGRSASGLSPVAIFS